MRDGRPNPDIWGNVLTCFEIGYGIHSIVGSKNKGLELSKAIAKEILPESVMNDAQTDGDSVCFTDDISTAIVADTLLEQELITDPKAISELEALRQLNEPDFESGFEPPVSDIDLEYLEAELELY